MSIKARPFIDRLMPAPVGGGYREDDYWVWCGSVVRADNPGEDGRYYMFASRWPKSLRFTPYWLFSSQIVLASSDTPEGPYGFEKILFERRPHTFFDGMVTHNPSIKKWNGKYYLYYFGTTYDPGEFESLGIVDDGYDHGKTAHAEFHKNTWNHKRIGLATADSVLGEWTRRETPLLEPRPGKWDSFATTNPSACIREDGYTVMIYKSRSEEGGRLQLGIATAPNPAGPYAPVSDHAAFTFDDPDQHVEDPYLWYEDGHYQVIMKDLGGTVSGEDHAGIHATSQDGINWKISDPSKAYSRTIRWDDGSTTVQGSFERPNLLFHDGKPTHLFAATADPGKKYWAADSTWNMVIPLRVEHPNTPEVK